jgi:hypothetical protein
MLAAPDLAHLISADWDSWLESVIWHAADVLDVVTHHSYPSDGTSDDVTEKLDQGSPWPWDPPSVREVLNDTGWRGRPFWLTETGVESARVGEAGQADFYTGLLIDWYAPRRSRSWVDRMFFYEIADAPSQTENSWGILGEPPTLEPKLAYFAYRDFISSSVVDDASIAAPELPAFVASEQTIEIGFVVQNTGTTTWSEAERYSLSVEVDEPGWTIEGGALPSGVTVAPGETANLALVLTAPFSLPAAPPREVVLFARMLREERWFFGDAIYHPFLVTNLQPAVIVTQPVDLVVPPHASASFSVTVASDSEPSYQWRRNSILLADDHRVSGANSAVLELSGVGLDLLGAYDCLVTNDAGTVVSEAGRLDLVDRVRKPGQRHEPARRALRSWLEFRGR